LEIINIKGGMYLKLAKDPQNTGHKKGVCGIFHFSRMVVPLAR